MLDCLILGDSIAVGAHVFMKECFTYSKGGLNTHQWNKQFLNKDLSASTVIISLGTNDHQYINTRKELEVLRNKTKAKNVFWILPMGNSPKSGVPLDEIQHIVAEIAEYHGDTVIATKRLQSDKIHPSWAGYKELVDSIKNPQ
jgi:lysophospholipase L1-like esterase